MKKKFLFFMIGLQSICHAQNNADVHKILDNMCAYYQNLTSFQASFTYAMKDKSAQIEEYFEGKIIVKQHQYYITTATQDIINNGQTLWVYLKEMEEVTIDHYDPKEDFMNPANIYTLYQKDYHAQFLKKEQNNIIIELVPTNTQIDFCTKIILALDVHSKKINYWTIYDGQNTMYTYTIKDFTPNIPLKNDFFEYKIEKNKSVEVIDLRDDA